MIKVLVILLFLINFIVADILKENYITLKLNQTLPNITLDFESDNLEKFIPLDINKNGLISWKELNAKKDEIITFVLPHLTIWSDSKICKKSATNFEVYRRVHQSYIKLNLELSCQAPKYSMKVFYDLFFDVDKDQKAFVSLETIDTKNPTMLSNRIKSTIIKLEQNSVFESFINFLKEGIWHIWIGFDHILFLLMLLIPSVVYYKDKKQIARESLKDTFVEVLKIVTAFSIAHSITLGLSVLKIVDINSQFVEIAIALSVLFTALNNLFSWAKYKIWIVSFAFGLIHGFGFANVLKEMTLNSTELLRSLLGFNLGVEIGQIIIVLGVIPLLYIIRKTKFYKLFILNGFSFIGAVIAMLWAYERWLGLSVLPF